MIDKRLDQIAKFVAIDTCAVWNVLSSPTLHRHCVVSRFEFALTEFGLYECLHKPRKRMDPAAEELRRRLVAAREADQFRSYSLSVEDLQELARVERTRKGLGMGELAAMAFARRVSIGFQTDDQKARGVAISILTNDRVQTTPHVLGWLFFEGRLVDSDLNSVLEEHEAMERPLRRYFEAMYREALRCRLDVRRSEAGDVSIE